MPSVTEVDQAPKGLERKRSKLPLLMLLIVFLGAGTWMSLSAFKKSVVYYATSSEVLAQPGKTLRLSGKVVPGTIEQDPKRGVVTFFVTDGKAEIQVHYEGPVPDTLNDEAEAVAEGLLRPDGVFYAHRVLAKCPSKFEKKPEAERAGRGDGV